jgi:glycosyl transferase family 1
MNKNINTLFLKHIVQDYLDYHSDACEKYFDTCISLNYANYFLDHGVAELHQEIERIIAKDDIKIIFIGIYWNMFQLSPEFINSLRDRCKIVFLLFDDETFLHAHSKYFAQTADFIISTDTLGQAYYEALDIPTYRYASFFPRKTYSYDPKTEQDIDVSFVGAVEKGNRVEYLNYLLDNGIKLESWGYGTKRGMVSLEEMIQIFRRSKINLNLVDMSMFDWICERFPLSPRVKQKKGRQIEVALTNSFCLQEHCPDLKYYFEPDVEMAVFRSKEEMLEKVKYFLEHEAERKAMTEKAYKKSLENYDGSVGFPKMFDAMLEAINNNEPYRETELTLYLDSFYQKQYAAFLWLYTLMFIKRRKASYVIDLLKRLWRLPKSTIIRGAFFAMHKKETIDSHRIKHFKG